MDVKTLLKKAFYTKPLTEYTEEQLNKKVKRYRLLSGLLVIVASIFTFAMVYSGVPILTEAADFVKANELVGLAAIDVLTPAFFFLLLPFAWFYAVIWMLPGTQAERSELRLRALKREILDELANAKQ